MLAHVGQAEQTQDGRSDVYLSRPSFVAPARRICAVENQRHVVVGSRQFAVGLTHHFPVVTYEHENRIFKPLLAPGGLHEPPDGPVGVLHNRLLHLGRARAKRRRQHVGRVVADGEQGGEERAARGGVAAQDGQGVVEQEIVLHAEMVGHLLGRVIFLGIYFSVTVGSEEGIHIVVLRFVRHKKEGGVARFAQHRGQSVVGRNGRPLHGVSFQDGGEGVECGIEPVVRMVARRIAIGEEAAAAGQAVYRRRQFGAAQAAREVGRHRLHQHQDHVAPRRCPLGGDAVGYRRNLRQALSSQQALCVAHGSLVVHQVQACVFRAQVVERTLQEAEHRVDAQLVQDGAVAEIGCADLDGVVAHAAADAEEAEAAEGERQDYVGDAPRCRADGSARHGLSPSPAVAAQQQAERRGEQEEVGDVEVVGRLAEHHAQRRSAVGGPVPNRGIEDFGEVGEVRDVGGGGHKYQCVERAEVAAQRADHPVPAATHAGRHKHDHEGRQEQVAGNDVVKPQTAQESRGRQGHVAAHIVRQLVAHGYIEQAAQHGLERKGGQVDHQQVLQAVSQGGGPSQVLFFQKHRGGFFYVGGSGAAVSGQLPLSCGGWGRVGAVLTAVTAPKWRAAGP